MTYSKWGHHFAITNIHEHAGCIEQQLIKMANVIFCLIANIDRPIKEKFYGHLCLRMICSHSKCHSDKGDFPSFPNIITKFCEFFYSKFSLINLSVLKLQHTLCTSNVECIGSKLKLKCPLPNNKNK